MNFQTLRKIVTGLGLVAGLTFATSGIALSQNADPVFSVPTRVITAEKRLPIVIFKTEYGVEYRYEIGCDAVNALWTRADRKRLRTYEFDRYQVFAKLSCDNSNGSNGYILPPSRGSKAVRYMLTINSSGRQYIHFVDSLEFFRALGIVPGKVPESQVEFLFANLSYYSPINFKLHSYTLK